MCRIHHCWSALSWGNLCWAAHCFLLVKFVSSGQAPLAPPTMATVTGPGTTIHHAQCTLGCANKTSIDTHVCTVYMKVCNSLSLLDLHLGILPVVSSSRIFITPLKNWYCSYHSPSFQCCCFEFSGITTWPTQRILGPQNDPSLRKII